MLEGNGDKMVSKLQIWSLEEDTTKLYMHSETNVE